MTCEVNFDGLVGLTHHYGGLGVGNVASQLHGGDVSNPRAAALEALAKMRLMMSLGVPQAVLPPQVRPDMATLRRVGFTGDDATVLERAYRDAPQLLAACSSASSMWAANAATICPSADTPDALGKRLHITPANLVSQLHRSIEAPATTAVLRQIFADADHFVVHDPLPATMTLADEGAANHTRLCMREDEPGVQLFVYGRSGDTMPTHQHPARQTLAASQAIARRHGLRDEAVVFAQQHPAAIDAGVFHNDVIAVGHRHVLLHHEQAWVDTDRVIDELRRKFANVTGGELIVLTATTDELSLDDAVASYVFNSQLITRPDGSMMLIAPAECSRIDAARKRIERLVSGDTPIERVHCVDVRQSMNNGGGPACLRLRIVMSDEQRAAMSGDVMMTEGRADVIEGWIMRHYREQLRLSDLRDVALLHESRAAQAELMGLLGLSNM